MPNSDYSNYTNFQKVTTPTPKSDPTEEGLAAAMCDLLFLRLNAHDIYPHAISGKSNGRNGSKTIYLNNYHIVIKDDGTTFIRINFSTTYASKDTPLHIYNPEIILNKLIKACLFVESIMKHMKNPPEDWLSHGIYCVMKGSPEIHMKHDKWHPESLIEAPTEFKQQYYQEWPHITR